MKKLITILVVVLACAICGLISKSMTKSSNNGMPAMRDANIKAASVVNTTGGAVVGKSPSNGVCTTADLVFTNAVMAVDSRRRVKVPSEEWSRYRAEEYEASLRGGAKAKVTVHVVDTEGNSVSNAAVSCDATDAEGKQVQGTTNPDGLFTVEGRLLEELILCVSKEGYYRTRTKFSFRKQGIIGTENDRWIPWNPTFLVTLKDVRHPIPMYARRVNIALPKKVEKYGFDFLVGDLVYPHGKGQHADIVISCFGSKPPPLSRNYNETMVLTAAEQDGGFIRLQKEQWSSLQSIHEAPQVGYDRSLTFNTDSQIGRQPHRNGVGEGEYLVVRSRVLENAKAKGTTACYGKIYGPITYGITTDNCEGAGVAFAYYFNPTPNDRNIEYAPRNNLFKGLSSLEDVYTP